MNTDFYDQAREQSQVKTTIVSKYFFAWANVMISNVKRRDRRILYLDLFAGPGKYTDGTKSTPIVVLEGAIQKENLREMLVTVFNDKNKEHCVSLDRAIKALPGIDRLKYAPDVRNVEVGQEVADLLTETSLVPTLLFVDPWGYKDLSLTLLNSVLKDWGCDCIFFFNYRRVNAGLANKSVAEHMNAIFGAEKVSALRSQIDSLPVNERELAIIEALCEALNPHGERFVLPFRFRDDNGTRTSHHLVFVSKHPLGYQIMKDIMAKESSDRIEGIACFEYSPAGPEFPLLHALSRPLDELEDALLDAFAGQRLTMEQVYAEHNVGTPYVKANYKDALKRLETSAKIRAEPPASKRKRNTFAGRVVVTFPKERRE